MLECNGHRKQYRLQFLGVLRALGLYPRWVKFVKRSVMGNKRAAVVDRKGREVTCDDHRL